MSGDPGRHTRDAVAGACATRGSLLLADLSGEGLSATEILATLASGFSLQIALLQRPEQRDAVLGFWLETMRRMAGGGAPAAGGRSR